MRHLKPHCDAPPLPASNEEAAVATKIESASPSQDFQPVVSSSPDSSTSASTAAAPANVIMEIKLEVLQPSETTTTTTTTNQTTTTEHDHQIYNQYHHHHHHHHHLLSPQFGSARHETVAKLTQAQLDTLGTLFKIIRTGDYDEFSQMLGRKCFKSLLNVFIDGQTALHYSLIYGRNLAWCKELIRNGANPNLTNRAGWHPIHLAAFNGSRETMRYLIERIAS